MAEALYTIDILRLAASTSQWPALAVPDGSAERRSPTCGSRVRVDVGCDVEGRVAVIGVHVSACALGQASTAIMAGHALGRSGTDFRAVRAALAAYLTGESESLPDWPGIGTLAPARAYPARHASILLAFEAAAEAMDAAHAAAQESRAHG
ncbi:MAG TPA: iron-sulfur cluster assembly scaffold protein [Sphingobium sp.]|uniref:iron-sulfur cluster assembly scaffold protein n=1 Tax=Sphingobium sp. TaxID=1912891 RepID=UPI002ED10A30